MLVTAVNVSRDTKQLVRQSRESSEGIDQDEGLTALPHGRANAAAASGLPCSVWCVRFIQFRVDEWICLLSTCIGGKNINYTLLVSSKAKRKAGSPIGLKRTTALRQLQVAQAAVGIETIKTQ